MKQRIDFESGSDGIMGRGYYIRDYDFPHPIGPFESISKAHDWLVRAGEEIKRKSVITQ